MGNTLSLEVEYLDQIQRVARLLANYQKHDGFDRNKFQKDCNKIDEFLRILFSKIDPNVEPFFPLFEDEEPEQCLTDSEILSNCYDKGCYFTRAVEFAYLPHQDQGYDNNPPSLIDSYSLFNKGLDNLKASLFDSCNVSTIDVSDESDLSLSSIEDDEDPNNVTGRSDESDSPFSGFSF